MGRSFVAMSDSAKMHLLCLQFEYNRVILISTAFSMTKQFHKNLQYYIFKNT